jgi:hypothetical protein
MVKTKSKVKEVKIADIKAKTKIVKKKIKK